MDGILDILGNYSDRELKKIYPIVDKIEALDEQYSTLTNEELRYKTTELRERLNNGESTKDILTEAFATVREAAFRVLNMKHFRVQLIGGIVLSQGRIAEMKTGEGKTLVATLPSYLNALGGEGVHVITTNDYLAKRDKEEMGRVHEFLGLTTGVILNQMEPNERREQYKCDIVYGTNSEFGFDYLRDNMAKTKEERVQRGLNFCIVDEVDSILIDEARTPLIISGEGKKPTKYYIVVDKFAKKLKNKSDFEVDRNGKSVTLTAKGIEKLEKYFNVENYADLKNRDLQHHVTQALRANYTMHLNRDYIVKKGEVLIVDEFTGRVMEGRRFSEGLHEALEAKEGVRIQKESKTLATITIQNYFRMYNMLSGMSGTAITEETEFQEIYGLDVIAIPTNKPVLRVDHKDIVYKTLMDKYNAIVEDIISCNKKGQPVLVGTASIQKSEDISYLLKRKGIKHYLLNAKNHEREAKIVEDAGKKGAITIATNMAGRGTDIKIDNEVRELGGLRIIGTDRHEARRIDNQLKGRAGRQGDVGSSQFYISLQDDLFKVFEVDRFNSLFGRIDLPEHEHIEDKMVYRAIESAQKNIEGNSFEARKNIIGFDDVINKQRLVIYDERNRVLDKENIHDHILNVIDTLTERLVQSQLIDKTTVDVLDNEEAYNDNLREFVKMLSSFGLSDEKVNFEKLDEVRLNNMSEYIKNIILEQVNELKDYYEDEEEFFKCERDVLLRNVDEKWIDYLDSMEHLKDGIKLRSYRQLDPVREFQIESGEEFKSMVGYIQFDTIKEIVNLCNNKKINQIL